MLVIRLSRKGRHNHPMYRLLVAENSMPTDGKFVEIVGHYNPVNTEQPLEVKKDRVEYWISKGAQPSNTVAKLLNKTGFNLPVEQYHKAPKKAAQAKAEAAKNPPATPAASAEAEAPVAEETPPTEVVVEEAASVEEATAEEAVPIAEETPANELGAEPESAPVEEVSGAEPPKEESAS